MAQLLGRPPRYEGVLALSVYLGALVAGRGCSGPGQAPARAAWVLDVLSVAALAIGIEAALEATGLRPLASNVSRPGSLLGNASDQGAWAVLALGPLAIAAFTFRERLHVAGALRPPWRSRPPDRGARWRGRSRSWSCSPLCRPRRGVVIGLARGVAVVAAGVLALPASRARVLQTSPLAAQTTKGRALLWSETASLVVDHPLLGVGPNGYVDAIPAYHDGRYEREVGPQNPPDSPHNWILQAASAGGVLLALLAVALAGWTFVAGWRAVRRRESGSEAVVLAGLLAGLAGYAVALLFHFTTPGRPRSPRCMPGRCSSQPTRRWGRRRSSCLGVPRLPRLLRRPRRSCSWRRRSPRSRCVRRCSARRQAIFMPANHDFDLARTLRPWDPGVAQIATHAYAVLAAQGVFASRRARVDLGIA